MLHRSGLGTSYDRCMHFLYNIVSMHRTVFFAVLSIRGREDSSTAVGKHPTTSTPRIRGFEANRTNIHVNWYCSNALPFGALSACESMCFVSDDEQQDRKHILVCLWKLNLQLFNWQIKHACLSMQACICNSSQSLIRIRATTAADGMYQQF